MDRILDTRWYKDSLQYLVTWKGRVEEEKTWEAGEKIRKEYRPLCDEYHKKNPDTPKPLSITIPAQNRLTIIKRTVDEIPKQKLYNWNSNTAYLTKPNLKTLGFWREMNKA